ncbi:hypothetical protein EX30DRAFT_365411 [Ascodesmis nigricans]|uniref:Uncharacterized protein n=1 Tax=Ascodesmis nigricans TaxID=341454 RepID=A0A4S2MPZ2_9PEZI|nr:hypothetical protein EX30DRAFT_365411 [Ascodesmis nigricans]
MRGKPIKTQNTVPVLGQSLQIPQYKIKTSFWSLQFGCPLSQRQSAVSRQHDESGNISIQHPVKPLSVLCVLFFVDPTRPSRLKAPTPDGILQATQGNSKQRWLKQHKASNTTPSKASTPKTSQGTWASTQERNESLRRAHLSFWWWSKAHAPPQPNAPKPTITKPPTAIQPYNQTPNTKPLEHAQPTRNVPQLTAHLTVCHVM